MANITVQYGNFFFKSEHGYPTPNVSFDIENIRTSAGDYLMSERNITLQGVCYANKMVAHNSTANTGISKVDQLFALASGLQTKIFKYNNSPLTIQCGNKILISGDAVVQSIEFNENDNNWSQTVDYNIRFKILSSGQYHHSGLLTSGLHHYVKNVSDNYSLQLMDNDKYFFNNNFVPMYKVSRTISAVGQRAKLPTGALYYAKQWVANREITNPMTGILPTGLFQLYNQERTVELDESAGSYSITDSFIAKNGPPWIDSFDISLEVDENFLRTITINGYVQGLEPATGIYYTDNSVSGISGIYPTVSGNSFTHNRNPPHTGTKYNNAVSGYSVVKSGISQRIYSYDSSSQALVYDNWHGKNDFTNYKSRPINNIPLSSTESLFPFEGKITYSRTYNNRPMSIMTGAITENIQINSSLPVARFKEIKILGRKLGPIVYEYYNSSGLGSISVSYEGIFPQPTGLKKYSFPQAIVNAVDNFVKSYQPLPPYTGYMKQNNQTINITENKIIRNIVWEYTTCSSQ